MIESKTITLKLACWDNPVTIIIKGKIPEDEVSNMLYVSDVKDLLNTLYIACSCGKQTQQGMTEAFDYLMKKFD